MKCKVLKCKVYGIAQFFWVKINLKCMFFFFKLGLYLQTSLKSREHFVLILFFCFCKKG